jgi:hypothetical protein
MNPTPTTGGGAGGPQPNFSNIQTAPTVAQPANASPNRVMFNKKYLLSVPGLLRLGLIVIIQLIISFKYWVIYYKLCLIVLTIFSNRSPDISILRLGVGSGRTESGLSVKRSARRFCSNQRSLPILFGSRLLNRHSDICSSCVQFRKREVA